jgi:hypothetical protein
MALEKMIDRLDGLGDAHRKTLDSSSPWMPPADSGLWETYHRYCRETGRASGAKVGRCHFWHVVLVFAPLRRMAQQMRQSVGLPGLVVLGVLAALVGIEVVVVALGSDWWGVPAVAGGLFGLLSVGIGMGMYMYLYDESRPENTLQSLISEILDEKHKLSWGMILAMLAGPLLLVGLTFAFLIHQFVRFCGFVRDLPGISWVFDNLWNVFVTLCAITLIGFGVVVLSYNVYLHGWSFTLLDVLYALGYAGVFVIGLCLVLATSIVVAKGVKKGVVTYRKAHASAPTDSDVPVSRPNIVKRTVRFAWHVVRLIAVAVRYGYKSICHLVPVPPDPNAEPEEAFAAKTAGHDEEEV